jgi:hypothetical protein
MHQGWHFVAIFGPALGLPKGSGNRTDVPILCGLIRCGRVPLQASRIQSGTTGWALSGAPRAYT